jgi:trans-aconitate 2-methyltransferase
LQVLGRLKLHGDEMVVDAVYGSGRMSRELLSRLPEGKVIASDASAEMIAKAKENLEEFGQRVEFIHSDLRDLKLKSGAEGIFSTATFHWINDREKLFAGLHRALKPGGWLGAQCGAARSLDKFWATVGQVVDREPYAEFVQGRRKLQEYLDPEDSRQQLFQAGFSDVKVWTQEMPEQFPSAQAFSEFITTVNLAEHVKFLPEELKKRFVSDVVEEIEQQDPPLTLDYIRLNIDALK